MKKLISSLVLGTMMFAGSAFADSDVCTFKMAAATVWSWSCTGAYPGGNPPDTTTSTQERALSLFTQACLDNGYTLLSSASNQMTSTYVFVKQK